MIISGGVYVCVRDYVIRREPVVATEIEEVDACDVEVLMCVRQAGQPGGAASTRAAAVWTGVESHPAVELVATEMTATRGSAVIVIYDAQLV